MSMLKALYIATALAASCAAEVLPALEADDECSADADAGCAFHALQMRVQGTDAVRDALQDAEDSPADKMASKTLAGGPEQQWVPKINKVLSSKLGQLNGMVASKLKSKDPMTLNMHKKQVTMKKVYGMSSFHINAFWVKSITPPTMTLALKANFGSALKVVGSAGAQNTPFDVAMHSTSCETQHIVATLDKDTGSIRKMHVSGLQVNFGHFTANVHARRHFFAKMISNKVNQKMNQNKGKIAGKMAGKVTEKLNEALNGKLKDMINAKIKGMMAAKR